MKSSEAITLKRKQVRVVVVDDYTFMRDLMVRMLSRDFSVVASVGTAKEAVAACGKHKPDVLILDLNLPDATGMETLPQVKRAAPGTRVLLCTGYTQQQPMVELVRTGAHGFVEKTRTWEDFLEAVDRVSRGEVYFCAHGEKVVGRKINAATPVKAPPCPLTAREKEVVTLLAEGLTSKEIASKLHISVATVDTHRTNAMGKLKVRNVAALVSYAFTAGMMKVPIATLSGS